MVRNGITNRQIAKQEGVRENYVYMVLAGERTGYRIRRAIAAACGKPVEDLWPDTPVEYRRAA
jgi:lambda repressor-like predicted transcriptional regulator